MIEKIKEKFKAVYKNFPELIVRAPGRINLIGEHTDYQEGFVLPGAIERYVYLSGSFSKDNKIEIFSDTINEKFSCSLKDLSKKRGNFWYSYVLGVIHYLNLPKRGLNIFISGNLPQGKGLSSSAALEIGTAFLMKHLFGFEKDALEIIKVARKAENEFVGVPCGIMDQFASMKGKKDNLLFIDTRSLSYSYYPFPEKSSLIIIDSGVKRKLGEVGYKERRRECEIAVKTLKKFYPAIKSLRDIPSEKEEWEDFLPHTLRKRVEHVVSENLRVKETCEALERGDLDRVGKLMVKSHESLRENYEVTSPELDRLVELSLEMEGVYGARMTGAGFGGSIIILCKKGEEDKVISHITSNYSTPSGEPPFYLVTSLVNGAERVG